MIDWRDQSGTKQSRVFLQWSQLTSCCKGKDVQLWGNALTEVNWIGCGVNFGSYQCQAKWNTWFDEHTMRHYQRTINSIEEGFGHLGCAPSACRKMKPRCILYGNALWQGIRGLLFRGACKSFLTMVGTSHCSCKRYSQISLRKLPKIG